LENGKRIVMRVNSRAVTWDYFIAQVRLSGAEIYAQHPGKEANIAAAFFVPLKETLITQALFNKFADEHHLSPEVREVQIRTGKLLESRDPQMSASLKLLTPDQIKGIVRDALVREKVDKYIEDRATSAPPTQAQLADFVAQARPTTSPITVLRARHIVVRATPDMSQFNIDAAKAKAEEIRSKIRDENTTAPAAGSAPVDFEVAARQYSQDRFTAYLGGDLGYFRAGTMYPAVYEALKKLQPGDISDVVRTPVGFHIFQLEERRDDNLLLLYDKWRGQKAVRDWLKNSADAAQVETYLK
jgi:parvulin-like peptidyl-prolyl isomerase